MTIKRTNDSRPAGEVQSPTYVRINRNLAHFPIVANPKSLHRQPWTTSGKTARCHLHRDHNGKARVIALLSVGKRKPRLPSAVSFEAALRLVALTEIQTEYEINERAWLAGGAGVRQEVVAVAEWKLDLSAGQKRGFKPSYSDVLEDYMKKKDQKPQPKRAGNVANREERRRLHAEGYTATLRFTSVYDLLQALEWSPTTKANYRSIRRVLRLWADLELVFPFWYSETAAEGRHLPLLGEKPPKDGKERRHLPPLIEHLVMPKAGETGPVEIRLSRDWLRTLGKGEHWCRANLPLPRAEAALNLHLLLAAARKGQKIKLAALCEKIGITNRRTDRHEALLRQAFKRVKRHRAKEGSAAFHLQIRKGRVTFGPDDPTKPPPRGMIQKEGADR